MRIPSNNGDITLRRKPFSSSGRFITPGGRWIEGRWFEAPAEDAYGRQYRVVWTNVNWKAEDPERAADWKNPDYVIEA
jgi:hypothetical protein